MVNGVRGGKWRSLYICFRIWREYGKACNHKNSGSGRSGSAVRKKRKEHVAAERDGKVSGREKMNRENKINA